MAACGAAELLFLGGGDSHSGGEGGRGVLVGKSGAAVFVFNLQTGTKRHTCVLTVCVSEGTQTGGFVHIFFKDQLSQTLLHLCAQKKNQKKK